MHPRVELLLEFLDRAYAKSRWHSLLSAVEGLTAEEAAWTPPRFAGFPFMNGSICDLVFHVGADKLFQISRRAIDAGISDRRGSLEEDEAGRQPRYAQRRFFCDDDRA